LPVTCCLDNSRDLSVDPDSILLFVISGRCHTYADIYGRFGSE
jgi:hypothetical protein